VEERWIMMIEREERETYDGRIGREGRKKRGKEREVGLSHKG
jgi:hypothetical protein